MVYAQDINPDAVKYIEDRIHKESVSNVKTVLGGPDDVTSPRLAAEQIDDHRQKQRGQGHIQFLLWG
jgi:tRNA G37 N-methylase Trm5